MFYSIFESIWFLFSFAINWNGGKLIVFLLNTPIVLTNYCWSLLDSNKPTKKNTLPEQLLFRIYVCAVSSKNVRNETHTHTQYSQTHKRTHIHAHWLTLTISMSLRLASITFRWCGLYVYTNFLLNFECVYPFERKRDGTSKRTHETVFYKLDVFAALHLQTIRIEIVPPKSRTDFAFSDLLLLLLLIGREKKLG